MIKRTASILLLLACLRLYAQDVLHITIQQADSLFLRNNFSLLAKKYQVQAQEALIQQAKLWDNPSVYLEQIVFNRLNDRYFDMSDNGEYIVQVQQLIYTAGKRNKRIQLAMLNHQMSLTEFNLLMAQLKLELHQTFYSVYYLKKQKQLLEGEINDLAPLVVSYEEQFQKGNVSLKEVFRLKSLMLNLQNIVNNIQSQLSEYEVNLSVYLGVRAKLIPELGNFPLMDASNINILALQDSALKNRFDYQLFQQGALYNQKNLNLQKALAYPDIHIGYSFDKNGNILRNYSGVSLGMDLPLWNRNQGNIKAAEFSVKEAEYTVKQKEIQVREEVFQNWVRLQSSYQLIKSIQKDFLKNYDNIKDGMQENFKKRNISLLEYVDFYESYIQSTQNYFDSMIQFYYQLEQFNYSVGQTILK